MKNAFIDTYFVCNAVDKGIQCILYIYIIDSIYEQCILNEKSLG